MKRHPYSDNKQLATVNFFGGPSVGKSTTALLLAGLMKKHQYKIEFVNEFAKACVWEDWEQIFGEQDYMFAHQNRMFRRLIGNDIDYAVCDSSILLSLFYMPDDFPQTFRPFVREAFDSYDNINIFLDRNPNIPYVKEGRNQTEAEAIEIDRKIRQYFEDNNIPKYHVMAGGAADIECLHIIQKHVTEKQRVATEKALHYV